MENLPLILSSAALILTVGGFIISSFTYRKKAEENYVNQLEKRVDDLTTRMQQCEAARDNLASENLNLLKQIVTNQVIKK